MDAQLELQEGSQIADRFWRLNNLYTIQTKEGNKAPFRLNWAQAELLRDLHECSLILKARQLGFTTFIQIFMLDACLFNSNIRAGTIAHRLDDARVIFRDKVKFPYDHLPEMLKAARPIIRDSADELVFANNSGIRVSTSMRSGTLQYLHVSEYGQLCARYPDKAREIRTGALNAVQAGQVVFIESTAEGREGHFYDLCELAQSKQRMGTKLTPLDFRFHFFPWWKAPEYEINPAGVVIEESFRKYFDTLALSSSWTATSTLVSMPASLRGRVDDQINAARQTLSICWFDDAACSEGLKTLRSYRKDWDDERGVWRDTPRHDASSHGADAFQVLSVWWREMRDAEPEEDFETKMRREHAEHARAMEKAAKPKTLDELLEEYDLEMAED